MIRQFHWKRLMLTHWWTGCCFVLSVRMLPVAQNRGWLRSIIRVLLSNLGSNRGQTVHCLPVKKCLTEVECECCCFGDAEIS
ncbi:hypothetical protein GS39_05095 [Escherichia coli]|nr:hypothetical protein GS39_05095 [Escherichia coli]